MVRIFFLALLTTGCSYLPEMAKTIDDIETDQAINITVDKEAFKDSTSIKLNLEVTSVDK